MNAVENEPATIDGSTLRVMPTPPTIHLKTADDVRLEMAKLYRAMKAKDIETQEGTRLCYVLSQIGKMIELADIEKRIDMLESANTQRKIK
jgi:hypothetical protein